MISHAGDRRLDRRDVRMDGVEFFRASAVSSAIARLPAGNFSYCVAVRRGTVRLRVDFPLRSDRLLQAGDVVAVSGLAQHHFAGEAARDDAATIIFERAALASPAEDEIDLVVGCVPNEALALGSLTVGPVVVRRGDDAGLSRRLWQAIEMLEDEYRDESWSDRSLVVRRLAEIMLVSISRQIMIDRRHGAHSPGPSVSRQILKAVNAVLEAPARPWTVDQLARVAGMSRTRFAEAFKAATGETPVRIVSRLRLTQVAQRLSRDRLSIEAAAEEAGYSSSAAFVRAFQREFGDTPARWRRGRSDILLPAGGSHGETSPHIERAHRAAR